MAAHSKWEFFEVRYLLSKFRALKNASASENDGNSNNSAAKGNAFAISKEQLQQTLPILCESLFIDFKSFQGSKEYQV